MLVLETKHYPKHAWRQQPLLTLRNRITGSASRIQVSVTGCTNIWGQQIHTYSLTPIVSLSFRLSSSHVSWTWLKILIPVRRQRVRTLAFVSLCFLKGQRTLNSKPKHWKLTLNWLSSNGPSSIILPSPASKHAGLGQMSPLFPQPISITRCGRTMVTGTLLPSSLVLTQHKM